MKTVTISQSEYDRLQEASDKLDALEQTGVDDWQGYGIAMDLLEEWENN